MTDGPLKAGAVVGARFLLEEKVGQGSFGAVWSARDLANVGQRVAVKMLFPHRRERKTVQRFAQEAQILDKLVHPNVARLITFGEEGEEIFLAMELIEGEPLHSRLDAHATSARPIPLEAVTWIADQLTNAVAFLHANAVVHRDLKPRNIMINRRGQRPSLKVLDFGIAKLLVGSSVDPTTVGRMLGSLSYIAPEQLLGEPIDHRADVFSLGTVLYEVLTLHRTWARDELDAPLPWIFGTGDPVINSHIAIARRITQGARPRAAALRPELSPSVDRVLGQALAIDVSQRYTSASQLGLDLHAALLESRHGVSTPPLDPGSQDL